MSRRTRNFLIASSLVLVVGLCTGLVAYYNGALPGLSASAPDDFAYMPADASAVAYADVRSIMNSEFRRKLKQVLPTGEAQEELKAETGIDLEHDIDTVIAGFSGDKPESAVVLLRGRFNDGDIETRARQHGATVEEYGGKRLVLMQHQREGADTMVRDGAPETGGLAFLEPGLIALGEVNAIKRAIDARSSKNNVVKNADMMKFVESVQMGSNAWIVGRFDAFQNSPQMPEEIRSRMPAVQWFAVSANVNGGLTGTVRADARDDKAAEDLRALVNGALAAGRLMGGQDPRAAAVLNSLQVQGTGTTVSVGFSVPSEVLDVLAGIAATKSMPAPQTPR